MLKQMLQNYQVKLPLFNGNDAVLSGVCLNRITLEFPKYPLFNGNAVLSGAMFGPDNTRIPKISNKSLQQTDQEIKSE